MSLQQEHWLVAESPAHLVPADPGGQAGKEHHLQPERRSSQQEHSSTPQWMGQGRMLTSRLS